MIYYFEAMSSSNDKFYEVSVSVDEKEIYLDCTCMAGAFGNVCKHRTALIIGKPAKIFDMENPINAQIPEVITLLNNSGLTEKYNKLTKQLDLLKKAHKEKESELKQQINFLMQWEQ